MNKTIITLIKSLSIILFSLFISSLFINTLYYFDIINNNLINYIKLFISIIIFFIGGLYIGFHSNSKGYINGLKLSILVVIITLILNIIFGNFKLTKIIYYLITTICITFGSMIGINKTKSNSN